MNITAEKEMDHVKISKERIFIKIICQYKKSIEDLAKPMSETEKDINQILNNFVENTGKEIKAVNIKREGSKYKLILEVL